VLDVSELAQHASWPGILLAEGEMSISPTCGKAWMCPIYPLLVANTPLHIANGFPAGDELRRCVDSIMARSAAAETQPDRAAVTNRWQMLANQPDAFVPRQSGLVWPAPTEPEHTSGVYFALSKKKGEFFFSCFGFFCFSLKSLSKFFSTHVHSFSWRREPNNKKKENKIDDFCHVNMKRRFCYLDVLFSQLTRLALDISITVHDR